MSKYLIRSYTTNLILGNKERVKVKAFKTSDNMHVFLCKGANALKWREVNSRELSNGLNKSGTYIERGNDFLNVKNIDSSALAHM